MVREITSDSNFSGPLAVIDGPAAGRVFLYIEGEVFIWPSLSKNGRYLRTEYRRQKNKDGVYFLTRRKRND